MKRGAKPSSSWSGVLLAVSLFAGSVPALAQDSPDELGRQHFESGVAYLQESDYENALKAFDKAYALSKRPEILLNIATVHERRGDLKSAVASLGRYLEVAPKGDQRATVESRLANLKKRIESEQKAAEADSGAAPLPTPSSEPGPLGPGQPQPGDKGGQAAAQVEPAPNVPAYVLLGLGGVAAGGAVLTGILAKGEYDDAKSTCSPRCSNDDVSAGKTLALTSTILTGVAVVSASIGAILLFTAEPAKEKAARAPKPRWSVGFAPLRRGAAAGAGFRF